MKDYEQLYFDSQYEIRKLQERVKVLEQEIDIHTQIGNRQINQILVEAIVKYVRNNKEDSHEKKEKRY